MMDSTASQPTPRMPSNLPGQNKPIMTNKEMRSVTQKLKQVMLSSDCSETKIANFLFEEMELSQF